MRFMPWLFRNRVHKGSLTLRGPHGFAETFSGSEPGPTVTIQVSDPSLDWKLLINPELRFAEAYMDGVIEVVEGDLSSSIEGLQQDDERSPSGPREIAAGHCASALIDRNLQTLHFLRQACFRHSDCFSEDLQLAGLITAHASHLGCRLRSQLRRRRSRTRLAKVRN